jgi:ubiquinone/menaquinone biosynthesis C-methylase UbiE
VIKPQLDARYEAPEPPLQLDKLLMFQRRLFGDMSGALGALAAYVGDRLGLFRALAEAGAVTASDFAHRHGICPEMTAEWLRVMACAGYVAYDPRDDTFALPPEHAVVLANDGGPMCVAGGLQQIGGFAERLPALLEAFRGRGGVPQSSYTSDLWQGMERLSATWLECELVDHWLAALPDVCERLQSGGTAADVGCGSGRALIRLAKSFPAARFTGYDAFPIAIERATRNAQAAAVTDRVSFEVHDIMGGIPKTFDLVTAFDSLHDMADPVDALRALGRSLKKNGTLLVLEVGTAESIADEAGPMGVILHATRLFYNLPVAVAAYGESRGNFSFTETTMRTLARKTELNLVRMLPVRNPLHKLYVLKSPMH